MKKIFDIRHIIIAILLLVAAVEFINPKGIMPNRTIAVHDTVGYEVPVHDTIPQEVEVEVPVEVQVEKPVPYAVHDTIQAVVDTNFIVKEYLNSINIFTNTYKFDKKQGSITITDTISKNKLIGRKYTTKITPIVDTLRFPEPFKRQIFGGIEGGLNRPDFVSSVGVGFLINSKSDRIYQLGFGVSNRTFDGTNGEFHPYIKGGVYWKIKLKK
ncbi:MAG: hypothetical protein RLZZ196_816 [Bacteroidota bacterium]|jgi:hypothetical protein